MAIVTIKNGVSFECLPGQSIIDAGLSAGVVLEHSCVSGRCHTCVAPIVEGEADLLQAEQVAIPARGYQKQVLMCCRTAKTDLILDVEGLTEFKSFQAGVLPCKIDKLVSLANGVVELTLRFPPSVKFNFNPGQYVDLRAPSGVVRSYSIANCRPNDALVLHVKRYEGGQMSKYLFGNAKVGDLLSIRGPLGTFHIRSRQSKNIVCLATGTGIAPILSMLSLSDSFSRSQSVSVYWGARFYNDFYFPVDDLECVDFFQPVLSRENHSSCKSGYVQDVVARDFDDFGDVVVYACGSPAMIDGAFELLTSRGLCSDAFFSDAFVESDKG